MVNQPCRKWVFASAFYFSGSNSSIQLKKDENSPPFDFSAPSISLLMTGK
jgi:hypothetical protein